MAPRVPAKTNTANHPVPGSQTIERSANARRATMTAAAEKIIASSAIPPTLPSVAWSWPDTIAATSVSASATFGKAHARARKPIPSTAPKNTSGSATPRAALTKTAPSRAAYPMIDRDARASGPRQEARGELVMPSV